MSDLIYNHITAKVPGSDGHFLINPFGLLYTEITASCFYTLDGTATSCASPTASSASTAPVF
jgi:ribulose-5-phosphate 4-epimerase/fuculose-1-phosphate aldolase